MSIGDTVQALRKKYEEMEEFYANECNMRNQYKIKKDQLTRMRIEAIEKYNALAGEWKMQSRDDFYRPTIGCISLHRRVGNYKPLDQILPQGGYNNFLCLRATLQDPNGVIQLRKFSDYEIVFSNTVTSEDFVSFCDKYSITWVPSREFTERIDEKIAQEEERLTGQKILKHLSIQGNKDKE